jgi:hypothetical protein
LEQIAIVAGDFDDAGFGVKSKSGAHHLDIFFGVFEPAFGVAGEVGIVAKDLLGGFEFLELDEPAFAANPGVQGIKSFHGIELVGGEIGIAGRGHSEGGEGDRQL